MKFSYDQSLGDSTKALEDHPVLRGQTFCDVVTEYHICLLLNSSVSDATPNREG